ncbi:hypothetical protein FF1_034173 [Malus domestica]
MGKLSFLESSGALTIFLVKCLQLRQTSAQTTSPLRKLMPAPLTKNCTFLDKFAKLREHETIRCEDGHVIIFIFAQISDVGGNARNDIVGR